jgi:S1-C subfamily serine protease
LVIVGLVWWRGLPTQLESEIATVVPSGNLAEDEKATIQLFATAAPAVGPLLDSSGRLIGVTTAIFSPSGAYAGIGFAIPVDTVHWVVPELIAHGKIIRPGIAITFAPQRWTQRLGVEGVLILSVDPSSKASKAGLRPTRRDRSGNVYLGDIIVAVGEDPIRSANELLSAFEKHEIGDTVQLTIARGRERVPIDVELETTN